MNIQDRLIKKMKKFIETTTKANEDMWKGQKPSCCGVEARRSKNGKR